MTRNEQTIYKVTTGELWAKGQASGVLPPSPVDEADGYMHFSTGAQLGETIRLYFAGQDDLVLAAIDVAAVDDKLKWEASRGGQLFPHLHAPLPMTAVGAHYPLSVAADGTCTLPEGIA